MTAEDVGRRKGKEEGAGYTTGEDCMQEGAGAPGALPAGAWECGGAAAKRRPPDAVGWVKLGQS